MGSRRPGGTPLRTYTARLRCDNVLTYEAASFLPDVGEVVPCRRHGFCVVSSREGDDGPGAGISARAAHRRSRSELMAFLGSRPDTTIRVLRRNRFTLRLVVAAQRDELVDVDIVTGRVAARACINLI
jgi:hypothetical protein